MDTSTQSEAVAIVTAMVAPAFFLLAAGALSSAALMRLSRSVDDSRLFATELRANAGSVSSAKNVTAIARLEQRSLLAERAVAFFFVATALFVTASLAILIDHYLSGTLAWLPIGLSIVGVVALLAGPAFMTYECRVGATQIREDIADMKAVMEARAKPIADFSLGAR
jgi:hypothetical protein